MRIVLAVEGMARSDEWLRAFATALPDAEVLPWLADGPCLNAEIAIVWRPPSALFTRETSLRAVFNLGAGVDALLALPEVPAELPLIRLEDAGMGVQMAEYALHALLRVSRGFATYGQQQQARAWTPLPALRRDDWPVGVLGMGTVGSRVARAIASLEYPVAGWSRGRRTESGIACHAGASELDMFLGRTRVLINTLPLTPETQGILDASLFAKLRPGAYIINIARGEHLVEDDLLNAIAGGHVAGAALDVFHTEPLPENHPFWSHPAITVTPHIAALTLVAESMEQIVEKIHRLQRGESVSGTVTRGRGY